MAWCAGTHVLLPQQPSPGDARVLTPQRPSPGEVSGGIDVALAADAPLVAGVIGSVRAHSSMPPGGLRFHLITLETQIGAARRALATVLRRRRRRRRGGGNVDTFGNGESGGDSRRAHTHTWAGGAPVRARASVLAMSEAWLAGRVRVVADPAVTGPLASPLNFARFYLARLLPSLDRVLYLDADVVALADVAHPWRVRRAACCPPVPSRWRSRGTSATFGTLATPRPAVGGTLRGTAGGRLTQAHIP